MNGQLKHDKLWQVNDDKLWQLKADKLHHYATRWYI